jgi:hypothetical protein
MCWKISIKIICYGKYNTAKVIDYQAGIRHENAIKKFLSCDLDALRRIFFGYNSAADTPDGHNNSSK